MGKPKAPPPPDPQKTAAAQTGTNVATSIANQQLQNVNQVTPYGNVTYNQTGTYRMFDPTSKQWFDIPKQTATQTFSPSQQAIFDQSQAAQLNLAGTAADQSAFLKDYLGQPVDLNNESVESKLFKLGRERLDPALQERRQRLESSLANRGVKMGSDAFDRAIELNRQSENDAYNQLLLGGRRQAVQEALTERNQPINEITALLSGSQVSQPQFINSQQPQIPTVDYAGLVQDNYNQQLGIWNQQNAYRNNLVGGLFGLGAAGIRASDKRVKKDIKKAGSIDGMGLYRFHYKGEDKSAPMHLGLMAQEVEKRKPEAVIEHQGIKMVDYDRALEAG